MCFQLSVAGCVSMSACVSANVNVSVAVAGVSVACRPYSWLFVAGYWLNAASKLMAAVSRLFYSMWLVG